MASSTLKHRNMSTKQTNQNGLSNRIEPVNEKHSFAIPFHSHSHSDEGHSHSHNADHIVKAFKRGGDRGSQITLVGLGANIALTLSKGAAGWALNSAALLADAAHSLSDLLGDFVTLFCWRWSRNPPSQNYPYGFSKFETLGTTAVSALLIGGALGIGFHSYYLLLECLQPTIMVMQPGIAHDILASLSSSNLTESLSHIHSHEHSLDPNAAWFALVGIACKEWLYRITKRVADDEKSSVLLANALHHRSDAYTSVVAFFAILGSWWAPWLPLDPIGGLLVSIVILFQGASLLRGALRELMDAGVSKRTLGLLLTALDPLISRRSVTTTATRRPLELLAIQDLRARRSGASMFIDLSAHVAASLTVHETFEIEESIREILVNHRSDVAEVRVRFVPVDIKNGHAH